MDKEVNDRSINPLIRIAEALEEVLRLVKKDQQDTAERIARLQEKENE